MKLTVLGCSGGIGHDVRTTSLRVDDDILIDAGTGVGDLTIEAMRAIDHVFLTHSHLDHLAALPLLLDTVGGDRARPVTVHAQAATLDALRDHIFNNKIWPDFSRIPSAESPYLRFEALAVGGERKINGRAIRSVPVNHVVPAVGYLVRGGGGSFAFSGDTTVNDEFWRAANDCADLRYLIVETTFPDEEQELARISKHLSPAMLASELKKYRGAAEIYVTHLMPGGEEALMREIASHLADRPPKRLRRGQVLEL